MLRVIDGPHQGKEYLFAARANLGRTDDNDVLVIEPGVSRRHARIYEERGVFLLEDLRSANGTRLNGEKIEAPEVLKDGDYISLSQTSMQFSLLVGVHGEATAQSQLADDDLAAIDRTHTLDSRLPWRQRLWGGPWRKVLWVALLLALGGGIAFKVLGGKQGGLTFDKSSQPLSYSDEDSFFSAVYGYGEYDQAHKDRVVIRFDYLGGRATLQYGAWGIDKVGELSILLDGKPIGKAPLTMSRWAYGLKLVLPAKLLKKGQTHELTFDNTRNPPHSDPWEVCYVQILQEAIPPPNPSEAQHHFSMAKKSWDDRELEPRNAFAALEGYRKARDLLEGLSVKPELYQETLDAIEKVDQALTRRFQEGLFSARRAQRVDHDLRKARQVLLGSLRYFAREDFRYRELQRYLDALSR